MIKARVESEILWNGQPHLRVRVQRTFKASKVKINNRQLLEKRGQEITCSCGNLRPDRVYAILGKEDRRKRVLYLDNFSTALEWSRNVKTYVRAYRRRSSCPERVEWNKERRRKMEKKKKRIKKTSDVYVTHLNSNLTLLLIESNLYMTATFIYIYI